MAEQTFAELQAQFRNIWPPVTLRSIGDVERTVVVVHSISFDVPDQLIPVFPAERRRTFPTIRWARADAHGLPYAGRLSSGTTLRVEGTDWVTWNPVADECRTGRTDSTVTNARSAPILTVSAAYGAANPDAPRIVIGDISFRHGGPMELHRSHQNGLDVDVYYPRRDGVERAPVASRQIDRALTQDLARPLPRGRRGRDLRREFARSRRAEQSQWFRIRITRNTCTYASSDRRDGRAARTASTRISVASQIVPLHLSRR